MGGSAGLDTLLDRIRADFEGVVDSAELHEGGDDFLVLEVNREWMFRFPRSPVAAEVMEREKRFLPLFRPLAPLPVPHIERVGRDYLAYRKIKGASLTPEVLAGLSVEERSGIARELGDFLSTLHSYPIREARRIGLSEVWGGWEEQACEDFERKVAPLLSRDAERNGIALLREVLSVECERVVVHGDFHPADHVFVDLARRRVAGVIDFGDLTVHDPAVDFKGILTDCGKSFLEEVLQHYSGQSPAAILDRAETRVTAGPLFHAAYALQYGFDDRLGELLERIERTFGTSFSR